MNQRIKELMEMSVSVEEHGWGASHEYIDTKKFANLFMKDIMEVVAAHSLSGDSAVDVFANLKRIYE